MTWFAAASGKRGRSSKFSDAVIQFCLTLKNLFSLALRQNTGLVASVLQLCGLAWSVPDFSTLCRRQRDLNVRIPYTRSQAGLHLLVDSTGIKFLGEGEWKSTMLNTAVNDVSYTHRIDADTLQIRAICVTSNNASDASVLSDLLEQLPPDETLQNLIEDGSYETQPAYEAAITHGAIHIIPPRKNERIRRGAVSGYRNAAIAACRGLGCSIWKRWIGYPAVKLGGNEDELHQTSGRTGDISHLRAPSQQAAYPKQPY